MLIAAVVVLCVVLFVLAVLAPRLSRHPERASHKAFGLGGRGASKAPGKLGTWLRVTRVGEQSFELDGDPGTAETAMARLNRFKLRTKADIARLDDSEETDAGADASDLEVERIEAGAQPVVRHRPLARFDNSLVGADLPTTLPESEGSESFDAVVVCAAIESMRLLKPLTRLRAYDAAAAVPALVVSNPDPLPPRTPRPRAGGRTRRAA